MHEVAPDDPRYGRPLDGPNLWPDLPGFRERGRAPTSRRCSAFCLRLLRPFAAGARPAARLVPALLRAADHLPAAAALSAARQDAADDAFGSAPHTDYGFITILARTAGRPGSAPQRRHVARRAADPRHLGGQCRRHAVALDQRPLAVDAASREEPVGRRPLLLPVLLRHVDGQHRRGAADLPAPADRRNGRRCATATICWSGSTRTTPTASRLRHERRLLDVSEPRLRL